MSDLTPEEEAAVQARVAVDTQDRITRLILAGALEFRSVDEHGNVALALTRRSAQ